MISNARLRNSLPYQKLRAVLEFVNWAIRDFSAPSPHFIKQSCIMRNAIQNATWVETGTYLGETTRILSKHGAYIYSVEPSLTLFLGVQKYFSKNKNIEIINGTSEEILPSLLPKINGNVNFWLDGHYSSGITYKGSQDTPILDELECIAHNLIHFNKVCILVDDIRCFNPNVKEYSNYPSLNLLVDWANSNNFHWEIEHDIFIAKN